MERSKRWYDQRYNATWAKDCVLGEISENESFHILKEVFIHDLKKCREGFVMDYESEEYYVELKTRQNTSDKYSDTMVGKDKIDFAGRTNKQSFFVFRFTDGFYYWKYNTIDLTNGNVQFRIGGRRDRGFKELKTYAYIKTEILKKIKFPPSESKELISESNI